MPSQPGYGRISKQGLVDAVDPQIRNVIYDLLLNGFITTSSCAGHAKHGEKPFAERRYFKNTETGETKLFYNTSGFGYIEFSKKGYNDSKVKKILQKHGLTGLKKIVVIDFKKPHIIYLFDPIGVKNTPQYIKSGGADGYMWEAAKKS